MLAGLFSRFAKSTISKYDRILKEQLDELEISTFKPCFSNDDSKLYFRAVELNEFHSFSVLLTGSHNINTVDGCTLTLFAEGKEIARKSDSDIIKGDYAQALNIGVTNFDIDRDDELLDFIRTNTIVGAKIETKNGKIRKEQLVIDFPKVHLDVLMASLEYVEPEEEDVDFEEVLSSDGAITEEE